MGHQMIRISTLVTVNIQNARSSGERLIAGAPNMTGSVIMENQLVPG